MRSVAIQKRIAQVTKAIRNGNLKILLEYVLTLTKKRGKTLSDKSGYFFLYYFCYAIVTSILDFLRVYKFHFLSKMYQVYTIFKVISKIN